MSRRRIIGPIFFNDTITAERYRTQILDTFLNQLHDDEIREGYFQQDGATAHTARATLQYLEQFYDNRLISKGLWPPRSPDLTPLDFFLFPTLKNNVFRNRLHTLDELRAAIIEELERISPETLEKVFDNMKRRVELCREHNGGHFEQFL
ncbi:uncharacterized protein LOC116163333 [Photinus pyralis]|nr:uncharacterized protein LOC116163333 [Photinus pyralis]